MIIETFRSVRYDPEKVTGRFVRFDGTNFKWCAVQKFGKIHMDTLQGTCDEEDLPSEIATNARTVGVAWMWPSYVEWPDEA